MYRANSHFHFENSFISFVEEEEEGNKICTYINKNSIPSSEFNKSKDIFQPNESESGCGKKNYRRPPLFYAYIHRYICNAPINQIFESRTYTSVVGGGGEATLRYGERMVLGAVRSVSRAADERRRIMTQGRSMTAQDERVALFTGTRTRTLSVEK